jgi:hypothetical protein
MARIALNCACGWNFFVPGTTPGHEIACPSCGQNVRIPGRKPGQPVPASAGAIAAEIQQKQRMVKILIGVGAGVLVVAGVLVALSSGGPPPPPPAESNEAKSLPKAPTPPRPTTPPDARPAPVQPPPPLFTAEQIEQFRRDIVTNVWLNNMSAVVSECARFRNFTNEWAQLQADMSRYDTKIKHDLGELARAGEKLPIEPYLQAGDQFIGFVDRDLGSLKPAEAFAFVRSWLKNWTAGPNQAQVNVQRGDAKLTIYIQFPEETKELLSLLRYPFLLTEPDTPFPTNTPDAVAIIPEDLLKDIQGRFDTLPPGYRNWIAPGDRKRLDDLSRNKRGQQEDIDWLRARILGEVLPGFEQESIMIRSKVQALEPKLTQVVASDRLIFKDGRKPLECEVVQVTDDFVKIRNRNIAVTYPRAEIERIEKGKGAGSEFPGRYAEAKGRPEKLVPLLAWCKDRSLKLEMEYVAYQILTLDAANDAARAAVGLDRSAATSSQGGLLAKSPEEFAERKIDAIAGEVCAQYKIFADVVNEMRRRTESLTTKTSPLAPAKSIKGVSVIGNPLTFKPADLTVPQSIEVGTWWGALSPDERREFARYFGQWCAYMRGMSRR